MTTILVIEDEANIRENIMDLLELADFHVVGAENGEVGVQMAHEHAPDLIVCDIIMPRLDGHGVLQALRGDSATATIPFIFLTAKADRQSQRAGMELGADDYLSKPFLPAELLGAVKTRLDKQALVETQRLRILSRKLAVAQEVERHRIARELYDEVNQPLTGLRLLLEMVGRYPPEAIAGRLEEAQAMVGDLIARVYDMSLDLRPVMLDYLGLLATLTWYFERYTAQTRVRVHFEQTELATHLPPEVEITAFRIVQEALSNVARHAGVSEVVVRLHKRADLLHVEVEDQGIGFDLGPVLTSATASGLAAMSERAFALDGQLTISSLPGVGTHVVARLPVAKQAAPPKSLTSLTQVAFGADPVAVRPPAYGEKRSHPAPSPAPAARQRRPVARTAIVLADAHEVFRRGIRALLEAEPQFEVVGETADGLAVTDLVERLNPDILVLALMMPGLSGLDIVRQVRQRAPQTQVLMLSMQTNETYVQEALRNGAAGYAFKAASASELLQAVREIAAGRRYLSPVLSERAIESYIRGQSAEDALPDSYDTLTSREREVFHLAAEGYKNAEIAERLSISARTVETHRANLMRKLGLQNKTDLIRYAMRRGVLPLDE